MPTDQVPVPDTPDTPATGHARSWRACREAFRQAHGATARALGLFVKLLILAYFVFCGLFLGLRYAVLPQIDNYRPHIERLASDAIGRPVTVAAIDASWQGLKPHLSLTNVAIHDQQGAVALNLPSVAATVSWRSLLVLDLRLDQLEVRGADMEIVRDAQGKLFVAGIPVDLQDKGGGKGGDWVLSQREITIRDGRVRWIDQQRQAPELMLEHVEIALRNHWQTHEFALRATPPAAVSAPLDIRARFMHPPFAAQISDATRWTGQLYADFTGADLTGWKPWIDYPFALQQGSGSLRAWLDFDHARVADFTADLTLDNVTVQLRDDLQALELVRVDGRVAVRESLDPSRSDGKPTFGAQGHSISLVDFSMTGKDGLNLPNTTISEQYTPARNGKPERTEVRARLLDLQTLANFVGRLPLPPAQLKLLADYAPQGQLKDFAASWQGSYPDIESYQVNGEFAGLSMQAQPARPARQKTAAAPARAAVPAIPGGSNLTGRINASDKGGQIQLASRQLTLAVPGYFAEPEIVFERLDADAEWTFQQHEKLLLEVKKLEFEQQGLSAAFSGRHLMPLDRSLDKSLGTIDVRGTLTGLQLDKVRNYLPLQTPQHLHDWLSGALAGGTLRDAQVRLKGDLAKFPFNGTPAERAAGEFSVAGKIEDGRLYYMPVEAGKPPLWPLLEKVDATIRFDRARLEIVGKSAESHNVAISNVRAVVPDLLDHDLVLEIDGTGTGALQDMVRYTVDSPVAGWIAHFTDETKASGNARLALQLRLPLNHVIDSTVKGVLQFANNNVTLQNAIPPLLNTSGKLEFNETGLTLNGVKATFLGGPVSGSGGSQKDGSIVIKAVGNLTAEGMQKNYPGMQNIADRVTGGAGYSVSIGVRKQRVDITAESTMQGLGLNFPSPLRKAPNETLPLKFTLAGLPSDNAAVLRDEIRLTLGSAIAATYLREKKTADAAPAWRVLRGGIGINVPPPEPDSGVIANVSLKTLNIDDWNGVVSAIAGTPAAGAAAEDDLLGIAQYIEPEVLAARATELTIMGKKLDNVVVGASHQQDVWQANIDSVQASGYVSWNESRSGRGPGRVTARLASLIIPESAESDVTELLEGKNTTTQIPALDIVAERFELFGKRFGHLELQANNVRAGGTREWRIGKLSIVNPDAELSATGNWSSKGDSSHSSLLYTLNIADAGKLLERFGFPNVLRGGKGRMDGDLGWNGLPFTLDIPSLSGKISLNMAAGQFLKVEPGAAKLLGVLSLQSLPRRLTLDFRDVFSEGFAFDGVTANATIANGIASTENFKMRSINATVLMDGSADIARESQNLHVVVIPEVNVGAASVAYALAVNPVIGIGSFLAQLFLREPLMRAFTFEYRITGEWSDPTVTKVDRSADKTAPDGRGPAQRKDSALSSNR